MKKNQPNSAICLPDISTADHKFIVNGIMPLQEVIQQYVEFAVKYNNGAKDHTAKLLKIDRKTLYRRTNGTNNSR